MLRSRPGVVHPTGLPARCVLMASLTPRHQHPQGQTLLVTAGRGFVQQWDHEHQVIQPGGIVSIPTNSKPWHGAAPDVAMTHIAMQEALDGKVVEWLEQVTDQQYLSVE